MRPLDWAVVVAYLVWIVYDGIRRAKGTDKIDGYFLGNRTLPWWAIGLSVIATQMSAVTLVGTTGQAYLTGLRFIQFYFGLPLAMIILSMTAVPFFHRAKVYTAYEYLERRFDVRVRTMTSFLFLMGRAFSLGVALAAPAVVMSAILGWPLALTVLVICVPMILYTSLGGVQAVAWTDVKQMAIIVSGMLAAVVVLIQGIPHDCDLAYSLRWTEEWRILRERHLQAAFRIEGSRVGIDRDRDAGFPKQKFNIPIASGRSDHDFPATILQCLNRFRKLGVNPRRICQLQQIRFRRADRPKNFG